MDDSLSTIMHLIYKLIPEEWDNVILTCTKESGNLIINVKWNHSENGSKDLQLSTIKEITDYSENEINKDISLIEEKCNLLMDQNHTMAISCSIFGEATITRYSKESTSSISFDEINFIDNEYFEEAAKPLEWFFIKPLQEIEFIDDFEDDYHCRLMPDFRDLFIKNNGGSPSRATLHIPFVGKFKVMNLLSFNDKKYTKNEELITDVIKFIRNKNHNYKLLPFANCGFNNFICLNQKYEIVLFNSNKNKTYNVAKTLKKFLEKLKGK